MSSWRNLAQKNKIAKEASSGGKTAGGTPWTGPIDLLVVSPVAEDNNPPYSMHVAETQLVGEAGGFPPFKKMIRSRKVPGNNYGWAFSFSKDIWIQIDNEGNANNWPLGDFLKDEDVLATLKDRTVIRSITYKASRTGPNISKAAAIKNSDEWMPTDAEEVDLDDIPTAASNVFSTNEGSSTDNLLPGSASADPPGKESADTPATSGGKKRSRK